MTFRKDALLFYQMQTYCIVLAVASLALIPILGLIHALLYVFSFAVLTFVNPWLYDEFITINENGISCKKRGNQLWAYTWDSIAELKRSSRFLLPSVEVIIYNKFDEAEEYAQPNHYFQLGKAARNALVKTGHSSSSTGGRFC